ncbi:hypothetical protein FRC10_002446 [Ceratobasidium sp. 414]|nr:hypothetical protein FRC10_002446 [Ceratobasidium sp. 414]
MDASHDDERPDDRRRSDSRTARIELAQRRLENALATPNSPSSPWSARSALAPTLAGHSPQYARPALRSVSFSSEPDHRFPARRTDQPAFPSTFEDDESSLDDTYFHPSPRRASPSTLLPRPGLYASIGANGLPVPSPDPGTRSRSHSLATLGRRPLPAHAASYAPSSPLPAPGSQGLPQSWADSRFGIPAPISYARPAPPRQGDISNISPFVRDVGQILHDDFRELWGAERDDGGGSGTTSRRHSVSVVQPRRFVSHTQHHDERPGPIDPFSRGGGGIPDDDLLGNMLNLDLDDPPAASRVMPATFNPRGPLAGGAGAGLISQPSSLPTYPAPLQRHSPVGALGLHEHSPRMSTLEHVPEDGGSFRSNQNPSPERDAPSAGARGFISRPSLTQLRTDSLRTNASSEQRFSPSLSPNTQRGFGGAQAQYGQGVGTERGGLGLGLGGISREQGSVYGREQQGAGFGRDTGFGQGQQTYHPSASPRTSTFPVSPSAMRTGFAPAHPAQTPLSPNTHHATSNTNPADGELGRGLPLSSVPPGAPLYVVEFKAGRTDLFFAPEGGGEDLIRRGDLVIVEADRGKDLGKVVNDSISLAEVERFMMEGADDGQGGRKEIMPKRIYGKAGPGDTQLLLSKMQDEVKALQLCQTKIRQKKLPMEVIDAEYQWYDGSHAGFLHAPNSAYRDRRKLTFYYVADRRIDFRELVRELFRLYKTRIWMSCLQGPTGSEPVS